jgi:hypothetical protein
MDEWSRWQFGTLVLKSSRFFQCGRMGDANMPFPFGCLLCSSSFPNRRHNIWLGREETPSFDYTTVGSVRLVWSGCASGSQHYTKPKAPASRCRSTVFVTSPLPPSMNGALRVRRGRFLYVHSTCDNQQTRMSWSAVCSTQEPGFDSRNTTGYLSYSVVYTWSEHKHSLCVSLLEQLLFRTELAWLYPFIRQEARNFYANVMHDLR